MPMPKYVSRAVAGESLENFLNEMGANGYKLRDIQSIGRTIHQTTTEKSSGVDSVIKETSFSFLVIMEKIENE